MTLIKDNQRELMEKYYQEFIDYLNTNLDSTKDYFGNNWVKKQEIIFNKKSFNDTSYLFRKLFFYGYLKDQDQINKRDSFLSGFNHINNYIQNSYKDFFKTESHNKKLFESSRQDDFEGFWSELILLEYLNTYGFNAFPNDNPVNPNPPSTDDIGIMINDNVYYIEVKAFTQAKFYKKISIAASNSISRRGYINLRRKIVEILGKERNNESIIAYIDVSLHADIFSSLIISVLSNPDSLQKIKKIIISKEKEIPIIILGFRSTESHLLNSIKYIGTSDNFSECLV